MTEGDRVRKGDFLLQIDAVNPRALARGSEASMEALRRDLDSARANLGQARLDHRRAEENYRSGIIPVAELDRARTGLATAGAALQAIERRVEQARAAVEGARDTLAKTTVHRPLELGSLVWFSSWKHPFAVRERHCLDLRCECTDAWLRRPAKQGASFSEPGG